MRTSKYAKEFAKRGWFVFPVTISPKKLPFANFEWKEQSSNSIEQIEMWEKEFKQCNWAVDCGKSGLAVIDVDTKKGKNGPKSLIELELMYGKLPETYIVSTPSGGLHYYFLGSCKSGQNDLGSGLDTRSTGGYVLIPGSEINGKAYKAENTRVPFTLPKIISDLVQPKIRETKQSNIELDLPQNISLATDYLLHRAEIAIEGQGGDGKTYQIACTVRDYGLSEGKVFELMSSVWNNRCVPPWPLPELERKISNAFQYAQETQGKSSPTADFPDLQLTEKQKNSLSDIILPVLQFQQIQFKPREIFLDPWVTSETISMIYGDAGTGKSWLALSILRAIVLKQDFGAWKFKQSVPSLYLDAEMTGNDVQARIAELGMANASNFYVYSDAVAHAKGIAKANILNQKWRDAITQSLLNLKIRLWCVDNLASLTPAGDENTKEDWNPINQWLISLRHHNISTIILHHTNKAGGQRGTSSRIDNIDFSINLKRPNDYQQTEGARFDLEFEKRRLDHKELGKISNIQMKLIQGQGPTHWEFKNVSKTRKADILRLKSNGATNKAIADELGCTAPNITKWSKKLYEDGYLTKEGELTPAGLDYLAQIGKYQIVDDFN